MPYRRILSALTVSLIVALLGPSTARALPVRFADAVEAFAQGANEDPSSGAFPPPGFSDPNSALGAPDGLLVVLGAAGSLTASFADPVPNLPGADLYVFENPFLFEGLSFAELGFVEVSSNGSDFARFPSSSTTPGPIGSFGLLDPGAISGLAGLDPAGDQFDLSDLASLAEVTSGDVDLAAIRFVRIVDVVGDGSTLDTLGSPIYDPYPTRGTTGFDLDAIGVVPEPASGLLVALGALGLAALRRRRA